LARARNAKKQGATKSSETEANKGLSLLARNERDAALMREKQRLKDEAKAKQDQAATK
jgi:hypothetical protein